MSFKQFRLPCENFECIFTNYELKRPVVVVSIIGREPLVNVTQNVTNLPNFIDNIDDLLMSSREPSTENCRFDGYYDRKENVIYLVLNGPMDSQYLLTGLILAQQELENNGFLDFWSRTRNQFARALLFMFSFSHIVLLTDPGYTTNSNLIRLFKVMSYVRPKYQSFVSRALGKCRVISEDWSYHGRLCSPRLLFLFKDCPFEIQEEPCKAEQIARVKKLEHSLEDQIYISLRKSRLVKNVCSRAFFSIAPNDEFVFVQIHGKNPFDAMDVSVCDLLEKNLEHALAAKALMCPQGLFSEKEDDIDDIDFDALSTSSAYSSGMFSEESLSYTPSTYDIDHTRLESMVFSQRNEITPPGTYHSTEEEILEPASSIESSEPESDTDNYDKPRLPNHSFKDFLMKHVRKAHSEGFSDNMGKYSNVKPFFEVPILLNWIIAVNSILNEHESGIKGKNTTCTQLEKLFGTELKFCNARCKKVLPLALAMYTENLPSHYSQVTHEKKVKHAVAVFSHHARGHTQHRFIQQLTAECEKIWKSGKQTCEALSLNKNPCTKPKHSTSSSSHIQLGESDHWSGVQFYSSCNCGAKQGPRQDPFTLRAANYDFYQIIGQECGCSHLEKVNFPVFQPTTTEYREADLSNPPNILDTIGTNIQDLPSEFHELNLGSQSLSTGKLWNVQDTAQDGDAVMSIPLSTLYFDHTNQIAMNYYANNQHDKHLVRQVSTTEYLPGMFHLESPPGLLPQFPSWSLICRGPSSLYSHNLGLHDYPGFIPGSSYLLPWDVSFREKDMCNPEPPSNFKKPLPNNPVQILKHRRNQRSNKEFMSVKIFIGIEYECVRGHRFMSSSPGVVLKATGTNVKEDAHRITEGNMPLFLPCPCGKVIAQLMRVHIVTPKAPVFVTIDPKVRPAPPPCPTFTTGEPKPIALSQSAYWVLRLPYVYSAERKFYSIPTRMRNLKHGELLGPMYGITQAPDF